VPGAVAGESEIDSPTHYPTGLDTILTLPHNKRLRDSNRGRGRDRCRSPCLHHSHLITGIATAMKYPTGSEMRENSGDGRVIEAVGEPNTTHRTRHNRRRRIRIIARFWESELESLHGYGNQNQNQNHCTIMGIRIRISSRLWESESESLHGYGNQNQNQFKVMGIRIRVTAR
jgi:hypothetical protein